MSEPMPSDPDDRGSRSGEHAERADGGVVDPSEGPGGLLGRDESAPEEPSSVDAEATADSATADTSSASDDVRVCWLDDEDADTLIGSLSSETARSILAALHERERTASELADAADTSVQNVRHHLDNLQEAGLAEVTTTRYSVKGREMDVYGPTDERLVVAVGREEERSSFLDSLRSLFGSLAVLVAASVVVQWQLSSSSTVGATRIPDAVGGSVAPATGLSPGLLFFAGGLLVAATALAVTRLTA